MVRYIKITVFGDPEFVWEQIELVVSRFVVIV